MRLVTLVLLVSVIQPVLALECKAPARLQQAEAEGQTLLSWCEADGVKDGPFEQFSVQGGLQVRANYEKGRLQGEFRRYFPGGKVATEGEFKDGKMSGHWKRYHEDGRLRDESDWSEDVPRQSAKIEKPEPVLRTSHRWDLRLGLAHSDNNVKDNQVTRPGAGADLRLFEWSWVRFELAGRILPEYDQQKKNKAYAMQLGLNLEPLPRLLDPVALSVGLAPHFIGGHSYMALTVGARYLWREQGKGFSLSGAFFELTGSVDNHDDNQNNGYQGPGPGPMNNQDNYHHDNTIAHLGLIFLL
jgi:hypothetical protein